MHPEVTSDQPGDCPKCGMRLVSREAGVAAARPKIEPKESYRPLLFVVAGILIATFVWCAAVGTSDQENLMRVFMGFFFLTFGAFKALDWKGFVEAYATYDLLAARSRAYAFAYPAIEMALGATYLLGFATRPVHAFTAGLMAVGAAGVFRALRSHRKFRCACLGTAIRLPMSSVTLIEDLGMCLMALAMFLR